MLANIRFLDLVWTLFIAFVMVSYLIALFSVITDLFRDREMSGVAKAAWFVALLLFPIVTMLAYLVLRGSGMADRALERAKQDQRVVDDHIRHVAGGGPASEIAQAKALLDQGAISAEEYELLKQGALAAAGRPVAS